jgi:hypothetical protein
VVETKPVCAKPAEPRSQEGVSGYELEFGGRLLRLPCDFDPGRVGALVREVEASC